MAMIEFVWICVGLWGMCVWNWHGALQDVPWISWIRWNASAKTCMHWCEVCVQDLLVLHRYVCVCCFVPCLDVHGVAGFVLSCMSLRGFA